MTRTSQTPSGFEVKVAPFEVAEYQAFLEHAGWFVVPEEFCAPALQNSLMMFRGEVDGQLVGIARIVGDKGIYFYLQDMIIHPEFRNQGVGRAMMEVIVKEFKARYRGIMMLMAANGKAPFYEKFGFERRPEQGPGMTLKRD